MKKPNEKLMLKFADRQDYLVVVEILDWYLDHGLVLENIRNKANCNMRRGSG